MNRKVAVKGNLLRIIETLISCRGLLFLSMPRVLATEEDQKKTKQKLSETKRQLDQSLAGLQELGQENQNLQVSFMKLTKQYV